MEDVVIWYNKEGRVYDCSLCSMPDCSNRNTTDKNNCLLDKREVATQELKNKVMQAPEKIYITPNFQRRWFTKEIDEECIEYIGKNAFIEKAVKFLKDRVDIPYDIKTNEKGEPYADSYIDYATKRIEAENKFIEDFKKAMKL